MSAAVFLFGLTRLSVHVQYSACCVADRTDILTSTRFSEYGLNNFFKSLLGTLVGGTGGAEFLFLTEDISATLSKLMVTLSKNTVSEIFFFLHYISYSISSIFIYCTLQILTVHF